MKTDRPSLILAALFALAIPLSILGFAGCNAPTSSNKTVVALQDPNNQAKAVQSGVAAAATAFLANAHNTQYTPEVVAIANTLDLVAQGNPTQLTADDIRGLVNTAKVSPDTANQITAIATAVLGTFNSSFAVDFPTLKPNYQIFLIAVANGLHIASGGTASPLPQIPWPPVTAATGAPLGTSDQPATPPAPTS